MCLIRISKERENGEGIGGREKEQGKIFEDTSLTDF